MCNAMDAAIRPAAARRGLTAERTNNLKPGLHRTVHSNERSQTKVQRGLSNFSTKENFLALDVTNVLCANTKSKLFALPLCCCDSSSCSYSKVSKA